MAFTLPYINCKKIGDQEISVRHMDNSSSDFEDVFSDMHLPFDANFDIDEDSLKLEDINMPQARDVIFCDRMMTEAAVKPFGSQNTSTSSESAAEEYTLSLSSDTCFANSIDSAIAPDLLLSSSDDTASMHIKKEVEEEGDEIVECKPNSAQRYAIALRPESTAPATDENVRFLPRVSSSRCSLKRRRQDSTDALDHEPPPFCRESFGVAPYGRAALERGRSVRSLIRSDALLADGPARRAAPYVVRQQGGGGAHGVKGGTSATGCQILSRSRRACHSPRAASKVEHGSGGGGGYVLYPPTPPSSAHCSSDSDDGSVGGSCANYTSSYSSRAQMELFQSPIPHSGELRLSEEERRTFIAEGFPIPCKLPLNKQEERALKKVRRKIKNKISAQESRRKKKEYLETLEKKIDQYGREYGEMKRRCESLEATNKSLLSQLRNVQAMLGKTSSSTGTCLMVLVFCFALLFGGGGGGGDGRGEAARPSAAAVSTSSSAVAPSVGGSTLPTLWLPDWTPRLGYARAKRSSRQLHPREETPRAAVGPSQPPSRLLLGSEDESLAAYGPNMFNAWSSVSSVTPSCDAQHLLLPSVPKPSPAAAAAAVTDVQNRTAAARPVQLRLAAPNANF